MAGEGRAVRMSPDHQSSVNNPSLLIQRLPSRPVFGELPGHAPAA